MAKDAWFNVQSFWCSSVGRWWRRREEPQHPCPLPRVRGLTVCSFQIVIMARSSARPSHFFTAWCQYQSADTEGPARRTVSQSRCVALPIQWSRMQQIAGSRASMFRIKCIQIMRIYRANSMNCKWCGSCRAAECVSAKVLWHCCCAVVCYNIKPGGLGLRMRTGVCQKAWQSFEGGLSFPGGWGRRSLDGGTEPCSLKRAWGLKQLVGV